MVQFFAGAIAVSYVVIGLFFLRFWRETHDRFFALFALAFWVLGLNRVVLAATTVTNEAPLHVYIVRLAAFVLILLAILDKNLARGMRP